MADLNFQLSKEMVLDIFEEEEGSRISKLPCIR
jgi:hypothetical protein